jgi:hypothetical protein
MEANSSSTPTSQNALPTNSSEESAHAELADIFKVAVQTCEAVIASYKALDNAYKAIHDARMALGLSSPKLPCSAYQATQAPRAPVLIELVPIPRLLPLTPPIDSTPHSAIFSPLPAYAHIVIIISDYEPYASACWDIGPLNEFRAATWGGKEGKEVSLWRNWGPGGSVKGWTSLGDGEDRGAFARDGEGDDGDDEEGDKGEEGEDEDEKDEDEEDGCGEDDDEEDSSSDEYDSDTESDSDEYDSDDADEDSDIGINIVFG